MTNDTKAPERTDAHLIEKRGLYYRPDSAGYTGLKEDAGRYTLEEVAIHFPNTDSPNQDGMTFYHEDDAPEYSASCAWDVKLVHKACKEEREHALALVAAAYQDAGDACACLLPENGAGEPQDKTDRLIDQVRRQDVEAIRARIPDNAQAALDRMLQEAEVRGIKKAAAASDKLGHHCIGCGHLCGDPDKDLSLLRKGGARSCCPEREMEPLSKAILALIEKDTP